MLRQILIPAALGTLICGCTAVPTAGANNGGDTNTSTHVKSIADGSTFQISPGQHVRLADGSDLRYERLISDSRCPPKVQCVWAGDAVLAFSWTAQGAAAQSFELHTGLEPRSKMLGPRKLTLQSVEGEADAKLAISTP